MCSPRSNELDALTNARLGLGLGLFRHRVAEREPPCRFKGLARQAWLVASHIKPWRDCTNSERLNGANGLLLSPYVNMVFDRYWISFNAFGQLLCGLEEAWETVRCWSIGGANLIRPFSREQQQFMSAYGRSCGAEANRPKRDG